MVTCIVNVVTQWMRERCTTMCREKAPFLLYVEVLQPDQPGADKPAGSEPPGAEALKVQLPYL